MNFTEAIDQMSCGDKVRRDSWSADEYIYLDASDMLRFRDESFASLSLKDLKAPDWKIYNPRPTLNPCHCGFSKVCYCEEEVDGKVMFYAQCSGCGMRTGYTYDEEGSARIWNSAHPAVENPNKEIKVGDWILFKTADGKTRCSKVEKVCDDYVVTSLCDVLKGHILGKAVVATDAEEKRTNFEKYITAELLEDASDGCDEDTCFIYYVILLLKEKGVDVGIECGSMKCGECCARFVQWANAIAEEVKQ